MGVRIVHEETAHQCCDTDYVRVSTSADPDDATVTLTTIERVVDKSDATIEEKPNWHIKTLVMSRQMSANDALGLATCYAERKKIPVIYTDQ